MKSIFTFFALIFLTGLTLYAAPPTVTASNLKFSDIDGARLSTNFTAGNGVYRIIVMKEGSAVSGLPVNGREYTGNSNFGTAGSEFTLPGEYVVASKTSWASFTFQNLKPGTTYHIAIFEYNGTGTQADYLMLPLTGSQTTVVAPAVQAAFTTSTSTGNNITLNFTKGNGSGRLLLARKTGAVNASPADLANYYVDETFGNGAKLNTDNFVVYKANGTSVTVKNLEPNTTYHFSVFEYNGNGSSVFLTPGATTFATTNAGPTIAPSSIGLSYVEGNSFRLGCTQGNGTHRLFIMSKTAAITAVPLNGVNYTSNARFGTPDTEIAPGEFVVGATTGNSVSVTNLEANTLYYFRIYEYDKDNANYTYYLTSSSAVKTGTTALIPTMTGTNLRLTALTGNSASIGLTHGDGTYRMVVVKEGSPVDAVPADYTTYSGGNFGTGSTITPGNYVTHGLINGNPFTINNLKPGITYHVAIFEFNGNSAPVYSRTAATYQFIIPLEPTACSTAPWSTFYEGSSFRLIWNNGNGAKRIVVARKGSAVSAKPIDGVHYTASENVGQGDALAPGEFVVFNGSYYSVDLKQMDIGSTYHFAIFDYNTGADGLPDYLTSCSLTASASTVGWPTSQTIFQSTTALQATQATINFTKGNGGSRLFIMREGSPVNVEPQDLSKYTYNLSFGNAGSVISDGNYVVFNSSGTGSFTPFNLKPLTTYYVSAFEYNGSTEPAYLRSVASTTSFTTTDVPGATAPTTASFNPVFSGVDGNKFTFKWTNGNGEKRIVVMKKGSSPDFVPASATHYTANAAFGSGSDLGNGEYIVYNGNGNTVDISNLSPSSTYYARVYEYNGTGSLLRYLTSAALSASGSTVSAPAVGSDNASTSTTVNSITLQWENGNGSGRLVVMKEGSAPSALPADLSVYPANAAFKSGSQVAAGEYVVYAGNGNSVTVTGLTVNTYYFRIIEYNGLSAPVYNTTDIAAGSAIISSSLPIVLTRFTVEEKNGNVILNWSTSQEIDNSHFVIERSADGRHFEALTTIKGAGNSNTMINYTYLDSRTGQLEKIYYRLKQVDIDGKYTYSNIVTIVRKAASDFLVYPTTVQDQLIVKLPPGLNEAKLTIYNAGGALFQSQKIKGMQAVRVAQFAPGVYYLLIEYNDKTYRSRIIKL